MITNTGIGIRPEIHNLCNTAPNRFLFCFFQFSSNFLCSICDFLTGDESGAVAIYSGRTSDFPVGSPLSQIQPLDAFVFAGPGNKPSANLTETLIPGRQPYQLSNRQDTVTLTKEYSAALISKTETDKYQCRV